MRKNSERRREEEESNLERANRLVDRFSEKYGNGGDGSTKRNLKITINLPLLASFARDILIIWILIRFFF